MVSTAATLSSRFKTSVFEFAFVASFILNLILGKFLHLVSAEEEVYNYFNDKGNIINQLFVKKGWFWTTLVIVAFYTLTFLRGGRQIRNRSRIVMWAVLNYVLVTVWWIFFTQWFFGLPIMDRVFVWTGGKCVNISHEKLLHHQLEPSFFELIEEAITSEGSAGVYESSLITSYVCRKLKGSWEGGHDPSGHVFLLIHSSLYLVFESLPFWNSWEVLSGDFKAVVNELGNTNENSVKAKLLKVAKFVSHNPSILVVSLVSLWWWMLFMTSLYFHSIAEKFVGLIFGYAAFIAIYYVPRWAFPGSRKKID